MTNTWIVIPEGLLNTNDIPSRELSFVYKAVLDWVLINAKSEDIIYLAPGNYFNRSYSEDSIAEIYLRSLKPELEIYRTNIQSIHYLDTHDNALFLRKAYPKNIFQNVNIVCGKYHCLRSYLCFKSAGFFIKKTIGVSYSVSRKPKMVNRLFFYHYPLLHIIYEIFAITYNGLKILFK